MSVRTPIHASGTDRARNEFRHALRREIAKDLLAGLLANSHVTRGGYLHRSPGSTDYGLKEIVDASVRATDALLERLEQ